MTDTFDFVVVGGGSGGCAVAGRLSEDPKTSVAVLDAGGKNDNWVVTTPFALVLMVAGNVNNWAFNYFLCTKILSHKFLNSLKYLNHLVK